MEKDSILIRPDSDRIPLAFEADELLQRLVSKQSIKFLYVMNARVRQAIKERGENWRISPLPQSADGMRKMIEDSRLYIGGYTLYYYNKLTGTRYLTYPEFSQFEILDPQTLAQQLHEVQQFSGRRNRFMNPEVDFFMSDGSFAHKDFTPCDFLHATPQQVCECYQELKQRFHDAVPVDFREDNIDSLEWRNRMFAALLGGRDETLSQEILFGLSPEFFMQIEWLPGGRIENGELLFDTIFDERDEHPGDARLRALCDDKARGFIFNFIRELGDVEYVNIGRVAQSLSSRPLSAGRRNVYIAEIKQRDREAPFVRILRVQKWGILEHLAANKDLLRAILEAEEYTDYILDRRLGCRQLGMNLPGRMSTRKINEVYHGPRTEYEGAPIWSTYFERDYIRGVASDKIPWPRYQSREFSVRLAEMLGRAAGPNIIVGRLNLDRNVLFDDGDEVVIEDDGGLPKAIMVSDHTGTFLDYETPLLRFAPAYAQAVTRRLPHLPNPTEFAEVYARAFVRRFEEIQREYRARRRAFDTLFRHRRRDEAGSFAYRWEKVLERLDRTDGPALAAAIRASMTV